jgi:ADP-heptose:LPS heptosyltransferase
MDANLCHEAALRLRDSCLLDPERPDLDALSTLLVAARSEDRSLAAAAASELIRGVVEELSDRFEPALAACYVNLFSRAIAAVMPGFTAEFLERRYAELAAAPASPLRSPSACPREIIVLSRITLGADIAVTSVFLNALHARYPDATLWFAGPSKNHALFAGLGWVKHWPLDYPRGASLAERFALAGAFEGAFDGGDVWLMDPDSRISQLGLLPIAPLRATLFFESRVWAAESTASVSDLASAWCARLLGVSDATPVLAPSAASPELQSALAAARNPGYACISLGVGNNAAKRLSAASEANLFRVLADTSLNLVIDAGAGGDEAAAVHSALAAAGLPQSRTVILHGSFAEFCHAIQGARFYVGYDSAGQHAAAALGVPGITLFKGFANERMFQRWQPRAVPGGCVLRIESGDEESSVLQSLQRALAALV